jgi:hypothetical protein
MPNCRIQAFDFATWFGEIEYAGPARSPGFSRADRLTATRRTPAKKSVRGHFSPGSQSANVGDRGRNVNFLGGVRRGARVLANAGVQASGCAAWLSWTMEIARKLRHQRVKLAVETPKSAG